MFGKACPKTQDLRRFALGDVRDEVLESIANHLDECDACENRLQEMEGEPDEFTDELRHLASDDDEVAEEKAASGYVHSSGLAIHDGLDSIPIALDAGRRYSRLLESGNCRLGRYELLEEIGIGSFGHVFRARDTQQDQIVAIKIQRTGQFASDEEAKRFLREARGAASLKHRAIVALLDTGQTEDGVSYLVTDYVDGPTLESRLESGIMSHAEAIRLTAQIADGLEYAHQQGVIHRDVKPSNILLDQQGLPQIADFGLAKLESMDGSKTSDGRLLGTPAYMSPEHARGASHEADARTDVYSLGVILYEMLTGQRPFQGKHRLLLLQILQDPPRPLRQLDGTIPRDLETICLKAIEKNPTRRYQTAQAFAQDLERHLAGQAIAARPITRAERLARWCRKYPFAAALLVGVVLGSIVGFAYLKHLQTYFVQRMALDTARQYSNMLDEFNAVYSDARGQFFGHGEDTGTVPPPLPATLQIEIAERLSQQEDGMEVRVYSPHSFRSELRPRSPFERQTVNEFEDLIVDQNTARSDSVPFLESFQFVTHEGRPYLRYARGQVMKASCIVCHNTHPETPKTNWKEGDLAGVLALARPLDQDIRRTQIGFRGAWLLMLSVASLLTIAGLGLAWRNGQVEQRGFG